MWFDILLVLLVGETLLVLFLVLDSRRDQRARQILVNRYELEKIISNFSTGLSCCSPDQLDTIIQDGMAKVLNQIGAGGICWYTRDNDSPALRKLYSSKSPGFPSSPELITADEIPYVFDQLNQGKIIVLNKQEDLPVQAELDRKYWKQKMLGKIILIPSNCGTHSMGMLGVALYGATSQWTHELVSQLAVLSNSIVTTLERKAIYELLQESEQRFRSIFHEAPFGIALEDGKGKLLFVNPAMCAMLGYTEEELYGMRCDQFSEPEDQEKEIALFDQLQQGTLRYYQLDKRFIKKDGDRIWSRVGVSLLKGRSDGLPLVIGMAEDITEQKQAEHELHRAQSEMQRLAGSLMQAQDDERHRISRELHDDIGQRLSLFAVELDTLTQSLAALGHKPQSVQASLLQMQADEMTRDIHRLSHELHSTKLQHLGLQAALQELVNRVVRQHRVAIEFKSDSSSAAFPPDLELCFFRVTQEALNNVMKHSKAEYVCIDLSTTDAVAQLRIKDTGIGFDIAGSVRGIGLVSMRERLRMLGGELTINSTRGEGTEITARVSLSSLIDTHSAA